jgi:hypothetical protein
VVCLLASFWTKNFNISKWQKWLIEGRKSQFRVVFDYFEAHFRLNLLRGQGLLLEAYSHFQQVMTKK